MTFIDERHKFDQELEAHYARYPTDLSAIEQHLDAVGAEHPSWSSCRLKALIYKTVAEQCPVKVFRHCPFFFELDIGKRRTDLGRGGLTHWLKKQPFGEQLAAEGAAWWAPCAQSGLSYGWHVLDDNHHTLGFDNVLRHGLNGLAAKVAQRLTTARTDAERELLETMAIGLRSLTELAARFAAEARRLLADEQDPMIRTRLTRMADAADRVPAQPPETLFEAMNTILFMRETTQSLDSSGISTFGHIDRVLEPYYQRDLAAGRITREEAADLLRFFLAFSDVRFGIRQVSSHVGTNTTVGIGGCDARGDPVFNDTTRMTIEAYRDLRLVDPKLNARVSSNSPKAYLDLLADLIAGGCNSICLFNDDVIIPANVRMGKALRDCRLYVGGGCQENVLENTEVNSRATIYLNLLQVFLMGFFPDTWRFFTEREGIRLATYDGLDSFEALRQAFTANLIAVVNAHIARRNVSEREGRRFNPCPLHSTTIDDCIDKARDMMEGGARYNFGSVSLTGIGTLIDSLFAVRRVVFEEGRVSLARLRDVLAANFEDEEPLRQYLVNRVPKFGQETPEIREFSASVFAELAQACSGQANSRGGRYEASLFAFRSFVDLGIRTGATPDGRKAGDHLSPGMGPSVLGLGQKSTVGQVLGAIEPLDLTHYPVVAVLDIKMPASPQGLGHNSLGAVIARFIEGGGSVLQINCVDAAMLLDAKAHPERHPDLVVRISGYSAVFRSLPEPVQDEVMARTLLVPA